jgi:uncharacterized protein (DUF1778 family)
MSANTSGKRQRNASLHVYFLPQEHRLIREAAAHAGVSLSSWVRSIALSTARKSKRDARLHARHEREPNSDEE